MKHGLAAGVDIVPERTDWVVPQNWHLYTLKEHAVWNTLFNRQVTLLKDRACDDFLNGLEKLPITAQYIPNFEETNEILYKKTAWEIVAVPGLVPDDVFFTHLANRRFPAGQFIRQEDELDYLQEPDIFHDVFGHVPMLMNPIMADFIQAYGVGGLKAKKLGYLKQLARVYWYTVEFGLIQQTQGLRIYGAGIVSSAAESVFCLENASPNRINFDLERVLRTHYRIDDFQETYFVLNNMDELLALAQTNFEPLYKIVSNQEELDPGDIIAADQLLHHGTHEYFINKNK